MVTTAGSYGNTTPDPTDTTTPADTTATGLTNFDELTQFGVSPSLAQLPVPWKSTPITSASGTNQFAANVLAKKGIIQDNAYKETQTYENSVRALYGFTPEQVGDLQTRLTAGGFFGKSPNYVPNTPDTITYNKWNEILKESMRSGKTPDEIIDGAIEANGGLEAGLKKHNTSTSGAVSDITLMHPDDIRMVAKQVSTKTLGRGWNNAQLDNFVKTYQAMQASADTAARGSGATVVNPPSVQAAAETEARRQDPAAAQGTDADNIMQMVMTAFNTLGGG